MIETLLILLPALTGVVGFCFGMMIAGAPIDPAEVQMLRKENRFLRRRYRRSQNMVYSLRWYKRQVEEIADYCDQLQVEYANETLNRDRQEIDALCRGIEGGKY